MKNNNPQEKNCKPSAPKSNFPEYEDMPKQAPAVRDRKKNVPEYGDRPEQAPVVQDGNKNQNVNNQSAVKPDQAPTQ